MPCNAEIVKALDVSRTALETPKGQLLLAPLDFQSIAAEGKSRRITARGSPAKQFRADEEEPSRAGPDLELRAMEFRADEEEPSRG